MPLMLRDQGPRLHTFTLPIARPVPPTPSPLLQFWRLLQQGEVTHGDMCTRPKGSRQSRPWGAPPGTEGWRKGGGRRRFSGAQALEVGEVVAVLWGGDPSTFSSADGLWRGRREGGAVAWS